MKGDDMKRSAFFLLPFLAGSILFVFPGVLRAGGFDQGVQGARASGMGTAFVGLADDASAIFYNPAGIALLERKQGIHAAAHYTGTYLLYRFPEGKLSPSGQDSGRAYLTGGIPHIFYYRQFGKCAAGAGIYIPIGGVAGSWGRDVFGFDMTQMMAMASLTPSFAYAITPKLSIGVGLNFYVGIMKAKVTFDQLPIGLFLPDLAAGLPDDRKYLPFKLKQKQTLTGVALGWNAGILYRPFAWLSMGASVRAPGTDVKLSGPADVIFFLEDPLAVYLHSRAEMRYKLPYLATWGIAIRPIPNLVLVADGQYNGWGRTEALELTFDGFGLPPLVNNAMQGLGINFTNQSTPTHFKDTVKFMVGAEYTFKERYSVRLGYMYTPTNLKSSQAVNYMSWDTTVHNAACGFGIAWENFEVHGFAVISIGEWTTKPMDDPADPIGKPAGDYSLFAQNLGFGFLWYF